MNKFGIPTALALLSGTSYASIRFGSCPEFQAMEVFDVNRYTGRWYEIVRDAQTTYEVLSDCVNVNYDLIPGYDGLVQVHNKGKLPILGWGGIVGQVI